MDYWFAECLPCKWEERITHLGRAGEQDAAIAAAEAHVQEHHPRLSGLERAKRYMGHVQLRSENAYPPPLDPTPRPDASPPTPKEATLSLASIDELRAELEKRAPPTEPA